MPYLMLVHPVNKLVPVVIGQAERGKLTGAPVKGDKALVSSRADMILPLPQLCNRRRLLIVVGFPHYIKPFC